MRKGFAYLPLVIMVALVALMVPTVKYITSSDVKFDLFKRASEKTNCAGFSKDKCRAALKDCEWIPRKRIKCGFNAKGKCPAGCQYTPAQTQTLKCSDIKQRPACTPPCHWRSQTTRGECLEETSKPCSQKDCDDKKKGCWLKNISSCSCTKWKNDFQGCKKNGCDWVKQTTCAGRTPTCAKWQITKQGSCSGGSSQQTSQAKCGGEFYYSNAKCVHRAEAPTTSPSPSPSPSSVSADKKGRPEDKASCEEYGYLWIDSRCFIEEEKCKEADGLWTGYRCILFDEGDVKDKDEIWVRVWCPANKSLSDQDWRYHDPHWVKGDNCEEVKAVKTEEEKCEKADGLWTGYRCIYPGKTDVEGSGRFWCPAGTGYGYNYGHWYPDTECGVVGGVEVEEREEVAEEEMAAEEAESIAWCSESCVEECDLAGDVVFEDPCEDPDSPGEQDFGKVCCLSVDLELTGEEADEYCDERTLEFCQANELECIPTVTGGGCVECEFPDNKCMDAQTSAYCSFSGEWLPITCREGLYCDFKTGHCKLRDAEEPVEGGVCEFQDSRCVDGVKWTCIDYEGKGEWHEHVDAGECSKLELEESQSCVEAGYYCIGVRGTNTCYHDGGTAKDYPGCGVDEVCCSFGGIEPDSKDDEQDEPEWVYYNQNDPQWGNTGFENGCENDQGIQVPAGEQQGESFCGQTAFAMLMATYVDSSITPQTVQDEYTPWASTCGVGFSIWRDHLEDNGFTTETKALSEENLKKYITEGDWIAWASLRVETDQGTINHHSLITGVDSDGNFIFQDPWFGQDTTLSGESVHMVGFELIKPPGEEENEL